MPLFSIIIPVYNSANFLDRCISSVINQEFIDFEILLINDGSSDKSPLICDKWGEKDARIRVFHQVNRGASAARNIGLKNARGEYIQFVDSDDIIDEHCLVSLASLIKRYHNPDVIEFRLTYIAPNGFKNFQGTVLKDGIYDKAYIETIFLPVMLQTKAESSIEYNIFNVLRIIKNDLIKKYHIAFDEEIKRWEDWLFAMEVYNYASEMAVTSDSLYNYYGHIVGGLGGRYQPDTYKYVIKTYTVLDKLMGAKYEMFSEYAVESKGKQIERCIREIYMHEPPNRRKKLIMEVLKDNYVYQLMCVSKSRKRIFLLAPYVKVKAYNYAMSVLTAYICITHICYFVKEKISNIYHSVIKKGYYE